MATDANIYSQNQWQVAIKYDAAVGTVAANPMTSMQLVNVDMPITINDNPFIASEYRSGIGRTKKLVDHFATEKGQLKSISFGGILDTAVGKILLENCVGVEENSGTVDIAFDYAPTAFANGYSTTSKNIYTLTFALISPIALNTRVYSGCIVDELVFTEDQGIDGGRRHFTCTLLTKYNPSNDQSSPTGSSVYGETYYSIWDYTQHIFGDSENDKIIWKVELSLKSNPRFFGLGTDGAPELMNRGYPGIEANVIVGVKYDLNTMSKYLKYPAGTGIQIKISDNATISAATTGFQVGDAKLTSDLNLGSVDDGVFIDVPVECVAVTSGNLIQIAI